MSLPPPKPRYIRWNELNSVGNGLLDTEHHHLVELINDLYDMVSAASRSNRLDPALRTLEEILSYTDYHFGDEERLLVASAYPDLDAHRAQHQKLRAKTWELHNQFSQSPTRSEAMDILKFLRGWWTSHINHTDSAYSAYVTAVTSCTLEDATLTCGEDTAPSSRPPGPPTR